MKIFYFTGTGNSLAVAKGIGGELISIPQVVENELLTFDADAIGVIFPTYGLHTPKIVKTFLEKAVFNADYIFAVATCGMSSGVTLDEFIAYAEKNGYSVNYTDKINMVDNCLPQWEMDQEREKAKKKNIQGNINRIRQNVENRVDSLRKTTFQDKSLRWVNDTFFTATVADDYAKGYIIDKNCVKCGTCAKVCPVANIKVADNVQFGNYCIGCQACIHICPKKAIHVNKERSDARWTNPDVNVQELMRSNSRL